MNYGCCNCGIDVNIESEDFLVCDDCGGICCSVNCVDDHECDPEGDMDDED